MDDETISDTRPEKLEISVATGRKAYHKKSNKTSRQTCGIRVLEVAISVKESTTRNTVCLSIY